MGQAPFLFYSKFSILGFFFVLLFFRGLSLCDPDAVCMTISEVAPANRSSFILTADTDGKEITGGRFSCICCRGGNNTRPLASLMSSPA